MQLFLSLFDILSHYKFIISGIVFLLSMYLCPLQGGLKVFCVIRRTSCVGNQHMIPNCRVMKYATIIMINENFMPIYRNKLATCLLRHLLSRREPINRERTQRRSFADCEGKNLTACVDYKKISLFIVVVSHFIEIPRFRLRTLK